MLEFVHDPPWIDKASVLISIHMATVDQGINLHAELQQSNAVNVVSTLNFLPSVPSSWTPAHHDSYGAMWEPSNSGHEEAVVAGQANCMNLVGRMAYTKHNLMVSEFEEAGVKNWGTTKYEDDRENERRELDINNEKDDEHHDNRYLSPITSQNNSEVVQLLGGATVVEEEGVDELHRPHHGLLLASSSFLQQKRHLDHATPLNTLGATPQPFDSPLHKKQRAAASTKETLNNEEQAISNGSSEIGPALNTNGRPRAKRGSATDPQSVYARQRRERINERLKILQNLVPNGAKVDIVTMLEEAISYVKFLQLQVKLLSSDEYWMYAPTTYNGIDVSFDMLQHST